MNRDRNRDIGNRRYLDRSRWRCVEEQANDRPPRNSRNSASRSISSCDSNVPSEQRVGKNNTFGQIVKQCAELSFDQTTCTTWWQSFSGEIRSMTIYPTLPAVHDQKKLTSGSSAYHQTMREIKLQDLMKQAPEHNHLAEDSLTEEMMIIGLEDLDSSTGVPVQSSTLHTLCPIQRQHPHSRHWPLIRRKIQEVAFDRRSKTATFSWNFLCRTIANMTDIEKGRHDLYLKYIYEPNSWKKGLHSFPSGDNNIV